MPAKPRAIPPTAATPNTQEQPADPDRAAFWPETRETWLGALKDDSETRRRAALEKLATAYRRPILRRIIADSPDLSAQDSEDLCQQFFASEILTPDSAGQTLLERFDRSKGRLRDYLAAALRNFLASHHRDRKRRKRGGGLVPVPLDDVSDTLSTPVRAHSTDPVFDREWALDIFAQAFRVLERHYLSKPALAAAYAALRPYLMGEPTEKRQPAIAAELGLTPSALRQTLHRLRTDWRLALNKVIAPTVSQPSEVEDELRYLCEVLRQ